MEPDKTYPFASGSIEEVVAHLALWGEVVSDGFARVEYQSDLLRERATDRLRQMFAAQQIPFHTLTLPRHQSAVKVADFLMQQFRQLPEGIVSMVWSAEVFSKDETLEDSLRVLNFCRDNLAHFPLKQIWWMPYDFAQRVRQAIPDLNRWFFVQLELAPESPRLVAKGSGAMTIGIGEETKRVFMVPMPRNPHFVGREAELQALRDALQDRKNVLLTQAISGLGGIGKTQTACEYAYRHRDEYRAVLWTSAENESALSAGYRQIARTLDLPEQNAMEADAIRSAVRSWLQDNESYLLILDNADAPESVRPFLPERPAGHIVLTSRARQFSRLGNVSVLRLETLPETDAREYLLQRIYPQGYSEAERSAAEELAQELDGLPLALELAASYMTQQKRDIQSYLRDFRERRADLLRTSRPLQGDYRETVLATWEPNFRVVEERNPAAAELLNLSAFLAPDAIPFEIFLQGANELGPALATMLNPAGEQALNLIELLLLPAGYSLISVDTDDRSFAVHRLVQVAVRARLEEQAQRACVERLIAALIAIWPGSDYIHWQQLDRLLPHQLACVEYSKNYKIETAEAARLYNQTGLYLEGRAEYLRAEPLYTQALDIRRKTLPEGHPDIANSLNNLAVLYRLQGHYADAEPLIKEALDILRQAYGEQHPYVATSLNTLANLYLTQGRYANAEPLYAQALDIRRKVLPEGHPSLATSLNNLAALYLTQGRYTEAEPLYIQALSIYRQAYGKQHPSLATSLNNLAALYEAQGRYTEAEPLYIQALDIQRKTLPENHPDIAQSLNNLAALYKAQSRYTEAEPLYIQALDIVERALGPEHPSTRTVRENLQLFLQEQGQ